MLCIMYEYNRNKKNPLARMNHFKNFWAQKLIECFSFWAQKMTLWARDTISTEAQQT